MRLGEHLKAVADPEDGAAGLGELFQRVHHLSEAGDGAGAQVIAVGETARDDDGVRALEVRVGMPQLDGDGARAFDRVERVAVAVGSGKDGNANSHAPTLPGTFGSRGRRWPLLIAPLPIRILLWWGWPAASCTSLRPRPRCRPPSRRAALCGRSLRPRSPGREGRGGPLRL